MPTGYTSQLKDINYDLRQWLTTIIPRAFGIMISLKDESIDSKATIQQLRQKIEDAENGDYHARALDEAKKKLARLETRKDSTWKRDYYQQRKEDREYTEKRQREFTVDAIEHNNVKHNLRALKEIADNEISQNIINFAIEQIESTIDFDYSESSMPTVSHIYNNGWEYYKQTTLESCQRNIKYHTEQREKEIERCKERLEAYDDYVKFITQMDKIITSHTFYDFLQQLHARIAEKGGINLTGVAIS